MADVRFDTSLNWMRPWVTVGDGRHTGSDLNLSNTPFWMSVFSVMPVFMVIMTFACTRMPGSRNCRYACVDPASAPPNR